MSEVRWTVPTAHPAFAGHFPGRPILPGVVLLDEAIRLASAARHPPPAIRGLASAKFLRPVAPGSELVFRYGEPGATSLRFDILHDGQTVATGSFTLGAAP